jgi:hypothetical protein
MSYKPHAKQAAILDAAYDIIQSKPYRTTLRAVFYTLFQAGFYSTKADYAKWKSLCAAARKRHYNEWRPDTLSDAGRKVHVHAYGHDNADNATTAAVDSLVKYASVYLDHFYKQDNIIVLMFESAGMLPEFEYYAPAIDLIPLGGDASIKHKWNAAKRLDYLAKKFQRPVHVLYFGDYDPKGLMIPESTMKDIRAWVKPETIVHYDRRGITLEQVELYQIPEKVGAGAKAGTYEWEGLTMAGAAETVIKTAMADYINTDVITVVYNESRALTDDLRKRLKSLLS